MNFSEKFHLNLKTGKEKFNFNDKDFDFALSDFWRWSVSDILSNATRGILAEFIVAKALGADVEKARNEWDAYDLITDDGIKIEVKSSAYLQSWEQAGYSHIRFNTGVSRPWDWSVDKRSAIPIRSADIYVFCLLTIRIKQR
ncbi:hypothetical protein [uncultured Flavobacterium sp.]|uniref:hypothetical protein n=1 Tax=uncultured Flavobacterium sp. TaxID=165435 RepID=UPI0025FF7EFA|nr:hypothetical protein [uncultured Flavobacterium sp.]